MLTSGQPIAWRCASSKRTLLGSSARSSVSIAINVALLTRWPSSKFTAVTSSVTVEVRLTFSLARSVPERFDGFRNLPGKLGDDDRRRRLRPSALLCGQPGRGGERHGGKQQA